MSTIIPSYSNKLETSVNRFGNPFYNCSCYRNAQSRRDKLEAFTERKVVSLFLERKAEDIHFDQDLDFKPKKDARRESELPCTRGAGVLLSFGEVLLKVNVLGFMLKEKRHHRVP